MPRETGASDALNALVRKGVPIVSDRPTRRRLLRQGVVAAAALAAGGTLTACASNATTAVQPIVQQPKIIFVLRPWGGGGGSGAQGNPKTIDALLYAATEPWRNRNSGVDVKIVPNNNLTSDVLTPILGGTGPDVYHSWHPANVFASEDFTTDLTASIRKANADLTVFNKAQMDLFKLPNGIRALPCYLGTMTLAINEAMLDDMGLTYPAEGWTIKDYASLATSMARTQYNKKKVVGGDFALGNLGANAGSLPPVCVLQGFGGSYLDPNDPTKCVVDSAAAITATNWAYDLYNAKAIGSTGNFQNGTLGMTWAPSFFLPQAATTWKGFKWSYYPMPAFPVGGVVSGGTEDFYAANPNTKYPDLAWDMMSFLCIEPDWQRAMMSIFLLSPALTTLWDEWIARVPQYAPPLGDKNLKFFADLAKGNKAYPQQFARYQATQADSIFSTWGTKIQSGLVSVQEGLRQCAALVNALEVAAAAEVVTLQKTQSELKGNPSSYSAPPEKGEGNPFTDASQWVIDQTGTVTMLGTGYDVYNAEDACVFYCAGETASTGDWICRVKGIANVSCPSKVSSWLKVGLMARADLSDDTAMVSVHVTGGNKIEWQVRPLPGMTPDGKSGLAPDGLTGPMVASLSTPGANYLNQPIWLKLHRDGAMWSSFTSIDGQTWKQIGDPTKCQMAGAWVGLMACAHNGDFKDPSGKVPNYGYIRATFDHVSAQPALTRKVQLGVDGTAPTAGGPVPGNWATLAPAPPAPSSSVSSASGSSTAGK